MNKKKKILWIGDDIRMQSGTATMGRQMILDTAHVYDYIVLAGAITHPDKGKIFDLSQATNDIRKINNASVKLIPVDGYGNEQLIMSIIEVEKPDAVCMITDPRFFVWLFAIEKQIRSKIPIIYWNIWDSTPYPRYNRPFYESCDCLLSISKQTYNINKHVMGVNNCITIK
jgi:hypothetical protein